MCSPRCLAVLSGNGLCDCCCFLDALTTVTQEGTIEMLYNFSEAIYYHYLACQLNVCSSFKISLAYLFRKLYTLPKLFQKYNVTGSFKDAFK